ncbi:MAG: polysaccharide deacetylase family protein [Candidatus Brocadiia bacterium]
MKAAYSRSLCRSGALAAWLRLRPGRRHPWILNYHHIEPQAFAGHLACLARYYHVATLDACCAYVAGGASLPPNSVALTFDDGFQAVYSELYPILQEHGAPATVFVPTGPVDSGQPLWFNRLKTFVRTADVPSLRLGEREIPLGQDREAAYVAAVDHLNRQSVARRDALLEELLEGAELPPQWMARYRPLTWDQMRAMRGLVSFGGHTRSHPCLSRLSRAEAEDEVGGSKRRLEEMLDQPVRHFSYPFGGPESLTEETEAVVRAAGFASAVTTRRGPCRPGTPLMRLPRVLFDGSIDGPMVAARLSGLWLFLST